MGWIQDFIKTKESEILRDSNQCIKALRKDWKEFLKKDTYLIYDHKARLITHIKHGLWYQNVPWYLFWHYKLINKLEVNQSSTQKIRKDILQYNSKFVEQRLEQYKSFLDGHDDNLKYPLDEDQKLAVIKDDRYNLVIAAAGSGKTSVVTSKIAYLRRRNDKIHKNRILALAFTKPASEEMRKRIRRDYKIDIDIATFHKFGRSIIVEHTKSSPKLLFDGENINQQYRKLIRKIFKSLLSKPDFQKLLIDYLSYFLDVEIEESTFEEKEEYYEYMRNLKSTTLTNIKVKSISERDIANFLFKHNIEFEYEPIAEWADKDDIHKEYSPDFYLPKYDLYIEHWGLDEENRVPAWFSITSEDYIKKKEWALSQFQKHKNKRAEFCIL